MEITQEFVEVETGKGADAIEARPQLKTAIEAAKRLGGRANRRRHARPIEPRRALHQRPHEP